MCLRRIYRAWVINYIPKNTTMRTYTSMAYALGQRVNNLIKICSCVLSWYANHYSNSVARRPSRQPPLNRRVGHLPVGQDRAVIYGPSRYVTRDKNLQVNFFFLLSKNIEILSAPLIFTVFLFQFCFWMVKFGRVWAKLSFFMFRLRNSRAPALPVCKPAKMAHGLITAGQPCIVGLLSNKYRC